MARVKRELIFFVVLFFILAFAVHFDAWTHHPWQQIESLPKSPLGPWHPLYLTMIVYLVIGVVRLTWAGIKKLLGK